MADEWVKIRGLLPSDPKTISVADFLCGHKPFLEWLGVAPHALPRNVLLSVTVIGFVRIWAVANERAALDGNDAVLLHCNFKAIDEIAGVPGISLGMQSVRWLDSDEVDGVSAVRLPHFSEYNTLPEERSGVERDRKERNRERQRRYRERKALQDCDGGATVAQRNAPREEKRREEKSPSLSLPTLSHAKEGRKEFSWQDVTQRLGSLGVAEAVMCVKRARDGCGMPAEWAMSVLDFAEANRKAPGEIYFRLGRPLPKIEDGWPTNGEATKQIEQMNKQAQKRRAEQAESLATDLVKKLRRQKKSDGEIQAALTAQGLEWPK